MVFQERRPRPPLHVKTCLICRKSYQPMSGAQKICGEPEWKATARAQNLATRNEGGGPRGAAMPSPRARPTSRLPTSRRSQFWRERRSLEARPPPPSSFHPGGRGRAPRAGPHASARPRAPGAPPDHPPCEAPPRARAAEGARARRLPRFFFRPAGPKKRKLLAHAREEELAP